MLHCCELSVREYFLDAVTVSMAVSWLLITDEMYSVVIWTFGFETYLQSFFAKTTLEQNMLSRWESVYQSYYVTYVQSVSDNKQAAKLSRRDVLAGEYQDHVYANATR